MTGTTPTPEVDLITRILGIDPTAPRDFLLGPVPEGYITIGTLSENAKRALCYRFDITEEIHVIKLEIATSTEAHNALHDADEFPEGACEQHHKAMSLLDAKIAALKSTDRWVGNFLTAMVKVELPQSRDDQENSIIISEGFAVSMQAPFPVNDLIKDFLDALSEGLFQTRTTSTEELVSEDASAAKQPTGDELVSEDK